MEKPFLGGGEQFGEIVFQPSDHAESQVADVVQKGGGGILPIGDDVIGKTWTQVSEGTAEKSPTGLILAIARAVGFDVQGQGQAGAHHTDHDQLMMVTEDLSFRVPYGTAEITTLFPRSSGAGPVQGQPEEAAVLEGFVALGLMNGGDRRLTGHRRVEPLREVSQGIIAEAAGDSQGAGPRIHQGFNAGKGGTAQQHPHEQSPQQRGGRNAPLRAAIAGRL